MGKAPKTSAQSSSIPNEPADPEPGGTSSLPLDDVKGIIPYPCCPKQNAVITYNAHGKIAVQCANCRKFLLIDNDRMTAVIMKPCRGLAARFKASGLSAEPAT